MKPVYLLIAVLTLAPTYVLAWGHKGHAAVANIASANLSPAAAAQVNALLKNDLDSHQQLSGRTTLAAVASWADEIREVAPDKRYKGWHSRANPVCSEKLGKCQNGQCVDQNIIRYTAVLRDRSQPQQARNEALKWIVHLVGDLHQPLHSGVHGKDADVTLEGVKTRYPQTLHSAWDSPLAELALKQGPIAPTLSASPPLPADAPTQWMLETRQVARLSAFDPLPGFTCASPLSATMTLDKTYQQQAIPVIREQISKAGLRLAQLLNESLQ